MLVVDDDRDTVISLTLLLRDEGYEVESASSAEQLWRSIRDFEPQAILLDIGLPDRNGYEIARDLRRRFGSRIALIAVTGWNKGSDKILAEISGFDHHVGKPYDPQHLLSLLEPLKNQRPGE